MRKTKIICTMGPATDDPAVLEALIQNGMNVARFNFSHGNHEEQKARLEKLKAARQKLGIPVSALLDTKGPEIRLKTFVNGKEVLETGQTFTLTTREVEGTKDICAVSYRNLPQDVKPGTTIMLDDGLIRMTALEVSDTDIVCRVENGGPIKDKKGVNVP
ncbi:MAG: pyruvate kinase, partial [Ruminiclostridium sp.]|nr:pyruvate kinase [Ruminiclostridium sp.]